MLIKIVLPQLGEGISKATVALWHVQVGQLIEASEDVVEVVTDKATFNVPSPQSGRIKEILVKEGEDVPIGGALALLDS